MSLSLLRSATHLAVSPLRVGTRLLTRSCQLGHRTSQLIHTLAQQSVAFLRQDRTASAAAVAGFGPLLLDLIGDPATETATKEVLQLVQDAFAILQTEELHQLVAHVFLLLSSRAVTQLVKQSATTLLALLHVLQTKPIEKIRMQLEVCISQLITIEASSTGRPSSSDPQTTIGSNGSAHSHDSIETSTHSGEDVSLRESVQLLLLVESMSAVTSGSEGCTCSCDLTSTEAQDRFSVEESRQLRRMIREEDLQLVMIYRFTNKMTRADCRSTDLPHTERSSETPTSDIHTSKGGSVSATPAPSMYTSGRHRSASSSGPISKASHSSTSLVDRVRKSARWGEGQEEDVAAQTAHERSKPHTCARHVPPAHARFVFCVREMLADLESSR
jgi:hypothetical protein